MFLQTKAIKTEVKKVISNIIYQLDASEDYWLICGI